MKYEDFKKLENEIFYIYRIYNEGNIYQTDLRLRKKVMLKNQFFVMSYIGMTKNPDRIFIDKLKEGKKNQTMANGQQRPIVKAIKKYGEEELDCEILCKVKGFEKACKKEEYFIKKFNSRFNRASKYKKIKNKTYGGWNITEGGDLPFLKNRN